MVEPGTDYAKFQQRANTKFHCIIQHNTETQIQQLMYRLPVCKEQVISVFRQSSHLFLQGWHGHKLQVGIGSQFTRQEQEQLLIIVVFFGTIVLDKQNIISSLYVVGIDDVYFEHKLTVFHEYRMYKSGSGVSNLLINVHCSGL